MKAEGLLAEAAKGAKERKAYPEWTLRITIFALVLGSLMTVASVYVGLKLSMVVPASAVAIIFGMLFKLRGGSIFEVNMGQMMTSSINVSAAGVIFTIPALYIMYKPAELAAMSQFNTPTLLLATVAGAMIGAAVIVPFRRRFIEIDHLPFPGGTANALLVRAPGISFASIATLAIVTIGVAVVEVLKHNKRIYESLPIGDWLGLPAYTSTMGAVSFLLVAVGFISGRGGLPLFFGGAIAYWVVAPAIANFFVTPETITQFNPAYTTETSYAAGIAQFLRKSLFSPIGIGMFLGSALLGVLVALPTLRSIVRTLRTTSNRGSEISLATVGWIVFLGAAVLFGVTLGALPWWRTFLVVAVGLVYLVIANMVITECTARTTLGPVSGLCFIGAILTYFLSGGNIVVAVFLAAAICSGIAQGGDMMDDLKTAHLIGADTRKAQLSQLCVAWVGPIVAIATVLLLAKSVAFGPDTTMPAAQASTLAGLLKGLSEQGAPYDLYGGGALIGALLTLLPIGGVGVLFGLAFFLPFAYTLPYGVGCGLRIVIDRFTTPEWVTRYGIPAAVGCILGESLVGVYYALDAARGLLS